MEEERSDESFKFMEELIANWLEGAHRAEIARVLDMIKAELRRRALADTAPSPPGALRAPGRRPGGCDDTHPFTHGESTAR